MVDGFIDYWDRHRAVLRTRNLAAQEGDRRFRLVRNRALGVDHQPAERQDRRGQGGRPGVPKASRPTRPPAALVAMMERMAAYHFEFEGRGVSREAMVETMAHIVHQTVTGRRA